MDSEKLRKRMEQQRVLIIGDVMIDRYVFGNIHRISPEAPVPILEWRKTENRLGGAANVALNIKSLGAEPLLMSVIGDDEEKNIFLQLLDNENISKDFILIDNERPTTVKTRYWASGQQLLRLDKETTASIPLHIAHSVIEKVVNLLEKKQIDVIIFQDYNKGFLTPLVIQSVIKLAQKWQIPTAVDPKKDNFDAFKNVTLFKPNLKEMSNFIGQNITNDKQNLCSAAQQLYAISPFENIMITLSEKGVFIYNNLINNILPTSPRNIADVCGAGDAVIAVAALALTAGLSIEKIAILANIAGGQVCEEVGVVPVRKEKFWAEAQRLMNE
jgi:D-glycero-beta-D-manno-heptose-7-phosphate kinase